MSIIINKMNKLRIYLDTSVIGGYFDKEFQKDTKPLFDCFIEGNYIPVISEIVTRELDKAPERVKGVIENLPEFETIEVTEEMRELAKKYLNKGVITNKYADDALHIAIATIKKVDVLVSWNFKHIVNLGKIHQFNAINLQENYSTLEIRTPKEVFIIEDE